MGKRPVGETEWRGASHAKWSRASILSPTLGSTVQHASPFSSSSFSSSVHTLSFCSCHCPSTTRSDCNATGNSSTLLMPWSLARVSHLSFLLSCSPPAFLFLSFALPLPLPSRPYSYTSQDAFTLEPVYNDPSVVTENIVIQRSTGEIRLNGTLNPSYPIQHLWSITISISRTNTDPFSDRSPQT